MIVYERDCCYLLYKFLKRDVFITDLSERSIKCAIDTYKMYRKIKNKKNNLTENEKKFLNYFYYDNLKLLMILELEIRKTINILNEIKDHNLLKYYVDHIKIINRILEEINIEEKSGKVKYLV